MGPPPFHRAGVLPNSQNTQRAIGSNAGFYPNHTLKSLHKTKDPVPQSEKTGVYKITCTNFDAFYIGQTGRSISQRLKEQMDAYRKGELHKSAMARHLWVNHHNPNSVTVHLIHDASKGRALNKLEEIEVVKAAEGNPNRLLNNVKFTAFDSFVSYS